MLQVKADEVNHHPPASWKMEEIYQATLLPHPAEQLWSLAAGGGIQVGRGANTGSLHSETDAPRKKKNKERYKRTKR